MLTARQIERYTEEGYLALPGFKSPAEIAALRAQAALMVDAFDPATSRTIFTTNQQERSVDRYFLDSATRSSCFFEEEAFDAHGALQQDKSLSINKIGHAMHDLDPVFSAFSRSTSLHAVAQGVGLQSPQLWQSMYIFKQPGIGGEVGWHQDATFFYTTPVTVTTFWFALEDATVQNACLWVQPGGHRSPLRERFVRKGDQITMESLSPVGWHDSSVAVPLEVEAGTLLVFHGLLPHYSAPNRSARSRHAYTLHVTDASSDYSPENWLQRNEDFPVRGFL